MFAARAAASHRGGTAALTIPRTIRAVRDVGALTTAGSSFRQFPPSSFPSLWLTARRSFGSPLPDVIKTKDSNTFGSPLPDVIKTKGWEGAWTDGVTPWDAGRPAPVINRLLGLREKEEDNEEEVSALTLPLPPGPVLVPGAGTGYDALEFAKAGRRTVALDIAPTAVRRALQTAERDPKGAELLEKGQLTFKEGDFFDPAQPGAHWAVIFDYTFLCALPKDMWSLWAETMTRIVRPDGELVVLVFPVGDFAGGPPFAMQPTTVRDLLLPLGWEEVVLTPIPPSLSHKARAGREWLARYSLARNRYPIIKTPHGPPRRGLPPGQGTTRA